MRADDRRRPGITQSTAPGPQAPGPSAAKYRGEPPSARRSGLPPAGNAPSARERNIELCRGLSRLPFAEAWRRVTEHVGAGHPIDNHIASSLLTVCRRLRALAGADRCDEVMRLLAASGVAPNESTYAALVAAYGDFRRPDDAARAFQAALDSGVRISEQGFRTAIRICEHHPHLRDRAAAFRREGALPERGVFEPVPGGPPGGKVIDVETVAVHQQAPAAGEQPSVPAAAWTWLPGRDATDIRRAIALVASRASALSLNSGSAHLLLRALGERGDADGLDRFLACMAETGQRPTEATCAILSAAYAACGSEHAGDALYWLHGHEEKYWDLLVATLEDRAQ